MKNGKIEFLRFIFCLIVLLFHCAKYFLMPYSYTNGIHFSLFAHGAMAVEFFFLLSGFLMAKSAFKHVDTPVRGDALFGEYVSFMRKKYLSAFSVHCIGFVFAFVTAVLLYGYTRSRIAWYLLDSLPNLFLIEMSGLRMRDPNHIEWYISCMLLSMAIFYPFCRKAYYAFTRYFAPLFALLTIGWMIRETGSLTGVTAWTGFCYKSLLRALADIALGACCFEFSRFLSAKDFSRGQKIRLTISEWLIWLVVIAFTLLTFPLEYEGLIPFLLFFALALSFSGKTGLPERWNHKWIFFLGKFSLSIYIAQLSAIYLVRTYGTSLPPWTCVWTSAGLSIVIALIIYLLDALRKKIRLRPKQQKAVSND